MDKSETLVSLRVPMGTRLLVSEIAARTGEPDAMVITRLVVREVVKLLRPIAAHPEGEARVCR